jgi:predicted dehydrogenase
MSKIAVVVIGAGAIGRAHIETIRRSQVSTLAGIAEPGVHGKEVADRLGVPWCADHADLLDCLKPDAAIIATPNATHRDVALACIVRGIPAIVEKPKSGVPMLVGHHRRHNPVIRQARGIIRDGTLGRITNASVLYTFYKPPEYFDLAWRRQPGGGPILINLIHEIDLIRHLCGEIASVQALTSNATRGLEVEDTAAVLLRLVGGALVTLSLSDAAVTPWSWDLASGESPNYPPQPFPVQTHFLCGTDGSLTLPTLEHWSYKGAKSWFAPISREAVALDQADPYMEQLNHLCRVVHREEAPLITAADGMQTLRATMAVHKAAQTGQMVVLE